LNELSNAILCKLHVYGAKYGRNTTNCQCYSTAFSGLSGLFRQGQHKLLICKRLGAFDPQAGWH